jgi:hypothetical protein
VRDCAALLDWQNTGKSAFSDELAQDLEANVDSFQSLHFADRDIQLAPLSEIVAELFDWIHGPVEIDLLVRMIGYLLDIKDQQIDSLEKPYAEPGYLLCCRYSVLGIALRSERLADTAMASGYKIAGRTT